MHTSTVNIPLTSLLQTAPTPITPAVAAAPAQGSTLTQTSGPSVIVATCTAQVASNSAPAAPPRVSTQPSRRIPWKKVKSLTFIVAKIVGAVVGTTAAYLALSMAMWSSAKDYREDCRSQKAAHGSITRACKKALNSNLLPPWGLSLFLSEADSDPPWVGPRREARSLLDVHFNILRTDFNTLVPPAVLFVVCVALAFYGCRSLGAHNITIFEIRRGHASPVEPTPDTAWVSSSVPRQNTTSKETTIGANISTLRRRIFYSTTVVVNKVIKAEDEWLPAGASALRPDRDYITTIQSTSEQQSLIYQDTALLHYDSKIHEEEFSYLAEKVTHTPRLLPSDEDADLPVDLEPIDDKATLKPHLLSFDENPDLLVDVDLMNHSATDPVVELVRHLRHGVISYVETLDLPSERERSAARSHIYDHVVRLSQSTMSKRRNYATIVPRLRKSVRPTSSSRQMKLDLMNICRMGKDIGDAINRDATHYEFEPVCELGRGSDRNAECPGLRRDGELVLYEFMEPCRF